MCVTRKHLSRDGCYGWALCLVTHDVHPLELDDDLCYRIETPADTWEDCEYCGIGGLQVTKSKKYALSGLIS